MNADGTGERDRMQGRAVRIGENHRCAEQESERGGKMNVLVLGGTRFFGIYLVWELLRRGHEVTVATRGRTKDEFGDAVKRLTVERTDRADMERVFSYRYYDVVYDDIAYTSGDVKIALDAIRCRRYVMVSSASVYALHFQTVERDFVPEREPLVWYESREAVRYDLAKRSAECALAQHYREKNAVWVRFPYVIGEDDYTDRLYFYVEHVVNEMPMYVENMDSQMSFISARDAGCLLAYLGEDGVRGAVNGASHGTVSLREVITYVEKRTGKEAVLQRDGDAAPYNGTPGYSINTELAERTGFVFSNLKDWLYELLDTYIRRAEQSSGA